MNRESCTKFSLVKNNRQKIIGIEKTIIYLEKRWMNGGGIHILM